MTKKESEKMVANCEALPAELLRELAECPPDRLTEGKDDK